MRDGWTDKQTRELTVSHRTDGLTDGRFDGQSYRKMNSWSDKWRKSYRQLNWFKAVNQIDRWAVNQIH